jgi:DNA (cytosine-5)-methyltransferase 1
MPNQIKKNTSTRRKPRAEAGRLVGNPKPFSILSLFSGAGALDYGFELTNKFKTNACIELEAIFCETLRKNQKNGYLVNSQILNQSVSEVDKNHVVQRHFSGDAPAGIIGGPPCESFSIRGSKKGLDDERGLLVFTFMEWVSSLKPQFFLMENVPPLAKHNGGATLAKLIGIAEAAGFSVSHSIVSAADYGSATKRRRLIVVGFLNRGPFGFPSPSHSAEPGLFQAKPYVTVKDAFRDLPEPSWKEPASLQGHTLIKHTPEVAKRFSQLRPGQQDNIRKRTRLDLSQPSPTLVAGALRAIRSHIHPTEPRELTNRESARIHSFPDSFYFCGNHPAVGKQIANSVPIPLAYSLAMSIADHLQRS